MTATFSTPSQPPVPSRSPRRSRWDEILAGFRSQPSEWRMVCQTMTRSVASQLASDFRNVGHRDLSTFRVRGVRPTDRFDARWGRDPSDPDPSHYRLWLLWSEVPWDSRQGPGQ